jgi:hypothetical protein
MAKYTTVNGMKENLMVTGLKYGQTDADTREIGTKENQLARESKPTLTEQQNKANGKEVSS